jgi:hypothetical protein
MNPPKSMAEVMLDVADQLAPIRDIIDGHRADLLTRGYSPTIAEMMAAQLHAALIASCFRPRPT